MDNQNIIALHSRYAAPELPMPPHPATYLPPERLARFWADIEEMAAQRGPLCAAAEEDSVVRLARFRAAHPDIEITPPGPDALLWTARAGGKILASDYWLSSLLDALDWLLTEDR